MSTRGTPTASTIRNDEQVGRYELLVGDELAGYLSYRAAGEHVMISSTVVQPQYRGRGLASELVRKALDDVRSRGGSVTTTCWYVREWLDRHPDYQSLERR
jgi:uncharacterized protein